MEDLLYELINVVKETAPHVWEIAVRHAIVGGIVGTVLFFVFAAITAWLFGIFRQSTRAMSVLRIARRENRTEYDRKEYEHKEMVAIISGVVMIITFPIAAFYFLSPWRDCSIPNITRYNRCWI